MTSPTQLGFPFASLDFEGHTVLTVDNIATKLRYTAKHILNLIEQGELVAIDGKSKGATRRDCRIAIEAYRAWVMSRMTAEFRRDFFKTLTREQRVELIRELKESLTS